METEGGPCVSSSLTEGPVVGYAWRGDFEPGQVRVYVKTACGIFSTFVTLPATWNDHDINSEFALHAMLSSDVTPVSRPGGVTVKIRHGETNRFAFTSKL